MTPFAKMAGDFQASGGCHVASQTAARTMATTLRRRAKMGLSNNAHRPVGVEDLRALDGILDRLSNLECFPCRRVKWSKSRSLEILDY